MDADIATEEVTEYEVTDQHIDERLTDLMTAFPAKVESYDASKQTCSLVPALNRALQDGQGNFVTEPLPKLAEVPVCFPRSGGFFCSFPLAAGDYVLVVCAQRNLAAWRSTGNAGDPGDLGMHTLDGAVAIPGVYPDAKALHNADATNMIAGSDTSPAGRIVFKPAAVEVGGSVSAALMDTLIADLKGFVLAVIADLSSAAAAPASAFAATVSTTPFAVAIAAGGDVYKSTVVKHG